MGNCAAAHFNTGSLTKGVELVDAIGKLADAANHDADIDVRRSEVTVQLMADEANGLSQSDIELARQLSTAAEGLGVAADPTAVQDVDFTIDAHVTAEVRPFWRAVLGYREVGDEDLVDPANRGPSIWFQQMDVSRPQRNRLHLDVWVPPDQAEARVAAALAADGNVVTDEHAPAWWTLADAEGNDVDVAT